MEIKSKSTGESRRFFIKVGEQYGNIVVDALHKKGDGKSYRYYDYHCVKCGKHYQRAGGELMKMSRNGCPECNSRARSDNAFRENAQYMGKTFGNLKVIDLVGLKKYCGHKDFFVRCKCLKCGGEAEYLLRRLKTGGAQSCDKCSVDKWVKIGHDTMDRLNVDGTNIAFIVSRKNGTVNKNNTSSSNGVCRASNGKWRAYITLKRKQYALGIFSEFEDAVAARKQAEKKFFDPEIAKFIEENPKTWKDVLKDRI